MYISICITIYMYIYIQTIYTNYILFEFSENFIVNLQLVIKFCPYP